MNDNGERNESDSQSRHHEIENHSEEQLQFFSPIHETQKSTTRASPYISHALRKSRRNQLPRSRVVTLAPSLMPMQEFSYQEIKLDGWVEASPTKTNQSEALTQTKQKSISHISPFFSQQLSSTNSQDHSFQIHFPKQSNYLPKSHRFLSTRTHTVQISKSVSHSEQLDSSKRQNTVALKPTHDFLRKKSGQKLKSKKKAEQDRKILPVSGITYPILLHQETISTYNSPQIDKVPAIGTIYTMISRRKKMLS